MSNTASLVFLNSSGDKIITLVTTSRKSSGDADLQGAIFVAHNRIGVITDLNSLIAGGFDLNRVDVSRTIKDFVDFATTYNLELQVIADQDVAPVQKKASDGLLFSITTASPLTGIDQVTPIAQSLASQGGSDTIVFTTDDPENLPPGITMGTDGVFAGTATQAGVFNWTARITDRFGITTTKAFQITVT